MDDETMDLAEFAVTTTSDGQPNFDVGLRTPYRGSVISGTLDDVGMERATDHSGAIGDELIAEQQRAQEVRRRVIELEALYFDDFGREFNPASRAAFECFMKFNPWFALPLLGAEESGMLVATWTQNQECLSIRFVDRFHLHFALTTLVGGQSVHQWGTETLATFPAERYPKAKRIASA